MRLRSFQTCSRKLLFGLSWPTAVNSTEIGLMYKYISNDSQSRLDSMQLIREATRVLPSVHPKHGYILHHDQPTALFYSHGDYSTPSRKNASKQCARASKSCALMNRFWWEYSTQLRSPQEHVHHPKTDGFPIPLIVLPDSREPFLKSPNELMVEGTYTYFKRGVDSNAFKESTIVCLFERHKKFERLQRVSSLNEPHSNVTLFPGENITRGWTLEMLRIW